MFTIENKTLRVAIRPKGAELDSVYHIQHGLEYLWSGDAAFWGKKSPVLFPIVGALKNDTCYVGDRAYKLSRHGFARDMDFTITGQAAHAVTYTLQSTAATLQQFPFPFRFDIIYALAQNTLHVTYRVTNTGSGDMYFSVGGHPAFRVPLADNTTYNDYYLEFDQVEDAGRWPIAAGGLIESQPVPLLQHTRRLPLYRELFYKDALVCKELRSHTVALRSDKTSSGLLFDFTGFPYLGIWAAKNADFVCIEPWCGIADSVHTDQQLAHKEGIMQLGKDQVFTRSWSITVL